MSTRRTGGIAEHKEGSAEYAGIKKISVPKSNGYPNDVANTQTVKTRGTGAATKGTKSSAKLG